MAQYLVRRFFVGWLPGLPKGCVYMADIVHWEYGGAYTITKVYARGDTEVTEWGVPHRFIDPLESRIYIPEYTDNSHHFWATPDNPLTDPDHSLWTSNVNTGERLVRAGAQRLGGKGT